MKLNELEFKPEELENILGPGQGGPFTDIYIRHDLMHAIVLADFINELLKSKLQQAQEVFCGFKDDQRFWGIPDSTGQTIVHECELKARLVCIEDNYED